MEENDKKRLTEWLGLCWHEAKSSTLFSECTCGRKFTTVSESYPNFAALRRHIHEENNIRTFAEDSDFFACYNRLVELGELRDFLWFTLTRDGGDAHDLFNNKALDIVETVVDWFLPRTESGHMRLCVLVAEWLKEDKDGHQ
jgi:hypothetical protein